MARPKIQHRDEIVSDLTELVLTVDEIAAKYRISRRSVYAIAEEKGLDMTLRTKLRRLTRDMNHIQDEIDRILEAKLRRLTGDKNRIQDEIDYILEIFNPER
jgi:hypothetical protein